jgi:hypothetical protein
MAVAGMIGIFGRGARSSRGTRYEACNRRGEGTPATWDEAAGGSGELESKGIDLNLPRARPMEAVNTLCLSRSLADSVALSPWERRRAGRDRMAP